MPKSTTVTKRWTITAYKVTAPVNPLDSTITVEGITEVLDNNDVVLIAQAFVHVISGTNTNGETKLTVMLGDVSARATALIQAGVPGAVAYYTATRDALYAQLQLDDVIPEDAV